MLKSARNFVSVNAEELNQGSPLFIEEQLFFQLNGTTQQVVLETFGQNVEIFRGKTILNDSTLTADKPYIIYDSLAVISGKTLTLAAGFISIKMQSMYVYGNLHAEGTATSPVVLRGDRFDKINFASPIPYSDVAGQWGGLYLIGNGMHKMKHVNISSGSVGVYLMASSAASSVPDVAEMLELDVVNCKIHNFLFYGLAVQNADIWLFHKKVHVMYLLNFSCCRTLISMHHTIVSRFQDTRFLIGSIKWIKLSAFVVRQWFQKKYRYLVFFPKQSRYRYNNSNPQCIIHTIQVLRLLIFLLFSLLISCIVVISIILDKILFLNPSKDLA